MAGRTEHDDFISDINVTPLVDVMLVLLIIMMVTASYVVARSLGVELPQAGTSSETSQSLIVTIEPDGRWLMDSVPISEAELRARATAARSKNAAVHALIAADGSAAHRHVVAAMDTLRAAGIQKVAIGVRPNP